MRPPYLPKYRAKKVEHAGRRFDSQLEKGVFDLLNILRISGEIATIQAQPTIYLTQARIGMRPDFLVTLPSGEQYYAEAKGFENDVWLLKLKLYRHYGPLPLHIYRGTHAKPYLHEIVIPKGVVD